MATPVATVDIAVLGSGAVGLTAAVTAAEGGARVTLIEKQRSLGGTSNFFQGIFAVESTFQRPRYIMYSRDEAFKNIMEYSHWRANPRLVRAVIDESAATIDWLSCQGVEFSDVTINMPDCPQTYHVVKGRGEALVKALVTRAKQLGVTILTGVGARRLAKTGERVTGVTCDRDGEEIRISAQAVVIGTGGYANAKDWIKKYTGFDLGVNLVVVGNVGKMGDGIRMAFEAGAAEEGISVLELYRVGPVGPDFAMACQLEFAATQPDLFVDTRGRRFCDETTTFFDTSVGNAAARLKEGYSFTIFDEAAKRRMLECGIEKNVAIDYLPGTRPIGLEAEIEAAVSRRSTEVFAADSVERLAIEAGMEPAVLRSTVDQYNAFCAKRHDDEFAKDPRYLRALVGPRFYAVRARTIFLGTMGGIKINEKAEVIDKKDRPILGLYAGGFDAGGMYGDSYPIKASSGLASAFALNSGRIAGRNASKYVTGLSSEQKETVDGQEV